MRVYITGVSCVGKTTIGKKLAELLSYPFFDLDKEIESYFGKPLERLQEEYLTMYSFRMKASEALKHLLDQENNNKSIIVLPPSGLMHPYYRFIKKTEKIVIVLKDDPRNILARITFYDKDSNPIVKHLSANEKESYLKKIKKDINYFGRMFNKADLAVDISGLGAEESAKKVKKSLAPLLSGICRRSTEKAE